VTHNGFVERCFGTQCDSAGPSEVLLVDFQIERLGLDLHFFHLEILGVLVLF